MPRKTKNKQEKKRGMGRVCGGIFIVNVVIERLTQKLHRIILLQFGLVTFRIHFRKTRKPFMFMVSGPGGHDHDSQNQLFSTLETRRRESERKKDREREKLQSLPASSASPASSAMPAIPAEPAWHIHILMLCTQVVWFEGARATFFLLEISNTPPVPMLKQV